MRGVVSFSPETVVKMLFFFLYNMKIVIHVLFNTFRALLTRQSSHVSVRKWALLLNANSMKSHLDPSNKV